MWYTSSTFALCTQHRKDVEEAKTHVADDPLALLTKEDLAVTASQLLLPNETVLKAIKRYAKKDKALSEQERAANKAAFEVRARTCMQGISSTVFVTYHVISVHHIEHVVTLACHAMYTVLHTVMPTQCKTLTRSRGTKIWRIMCYLS
jgi:hypothetical protein